MNVKALLRQLMRVNRKETVDRLLAGNDTQCFTTEQYGRLHAKLHWGKDVEQGERWLLLRFDSDGCLARMHLRTYDRVVEVKPDVWREK